MIQKTNISNIKEHFQRQLLIKLQFDKSGIVLMTMYIIINVECLIQAQVQWI